MCLNITILNDSKCNLDESMNNISEYPVCALRLSLCTG